MRTALLTEYRKLATTRLWWLLLLVMAAYMVFLGALMAFPFTVEGGEAAMGMGGDAAGPGVPMSDLDIALAVYTMGPALGYVFPAIVGALSVTNEFRHMTITPTLLAEPRRSVMLGSKLIAAVPQGLMFGVAGTLGSVLGGAGMLALRGHDVMLTDPEVLTTLGRSVLALAIWAVVGVGFGAALPHQIAAIVTILAFTQFVEPLLRIGLASVDALAPVSQFLPGAAGEAIAGTSLYSQTGFVDLLPWWQGLLVLAGYGLLLALIGRFTTFRRDIT